MYAQIAYPREVKTAELVKLYEKQIQKYSAVRDHTEGMSGTREKPTAFVCEITKGRVREAGGDFFSCAWHGMAWHGIE